MKLPQHNIYATSRRETQGCTTVARPFNYQIPTHKEVLCVPSDQTCADKGMLSGHNLYPIAANGAHLAHFGQVALLKYAGVCLRADAPVMRAEVYEF